jgi:deoxyadenosine/deoxycytidine kinase
MENPSAGRPRYVVIEGPIGVGKTSLAERLAERMGAERVMESAQNPFLKAFYEQQEQAAFLTQLFFLLTRYQQQQKLRQRPLFGRATVSDYLFDKDRIFAYLTLSDSELMVYEKIYAVLAQEIPRPDLVLYLQADTPVLLRRIRERGRDYEKRLSADYLQALNDAYNRFFFSYNKTPLLVVNTSEIDFVKRQSDLDDLIRQIDRMEAGTRYYVPYGGE